MSLNQKDHNMILAAIKRVYSRSDHRKEAFKKALSKSKGPKGGAMWDCMNCGVSLPRTSTVPGTKKKKSNFDADHHQPVVPIGTAARDMSFDEVVARTWCADKNVRPLCKSCHKKKSAKEAAERAAARRKAKKK